MRFCYLCIGAAILIGSLVYPKDCRAQILLPFPGMNIQPAIETPASPSSCSGFDNCSQFKTWGHIEVMTTWSKRPDFNTGRPWFVQPSQIYAFSGSTAPDGSRQGQDMTYRHVSERFRFHLQYGDSKSIRAVIGFEADSQDWGEPARGSNGLPPGTSGNPTSSIYSAGANHFGVYQSDMVQLEVMWAFLEFTVPDTPVQVAAGLQRFTVGGRLFMQNDAPGLKVRAQYAPHLFEFFWWRENDRARNLYQPNDYYGLIYEMNQKFFNFYAWGAYDNDLYNTTTRGTAPANTIAPNFPAATTVVANHPYWLAAGGGFRPGNFDFSGQFVYNGGKLSVNRGSDYTYQAYALEFLARYRIGPGLFAGLEYYYSTGNDANSRDRINYYTVPTSSESASIFGGDRTVFFYMNAIQMGYYQGRQFGFNGMAYYRGNLEYSPTSWVRFNLNYLYIEDTSRGTPGVGKMVNSPTGARQDLDKRKVGQEINLITVLKLYARCWYRIGIAYFLPGDVYSVAAAPGIPAKSAEAAYVLATNLIYVF